MSKISSLHYKFRHLWLKIRFTLSGKNPIKYKLREGVNFIAFNDNKHSQDIYIRKSYEDTDIEWCINWLQEGDDFIDCGANIGYFSANLAQCMNLSKVAAVEGNEKCAELSRTAFDLLGMGNIEVINKILHSNEVDELHINDMPGEEGLQYATNAKEGAGVVVEATTLDQLAKSKAIRPTLIKVDCEGAETEILKGSRNLLKEVRPAWIIEINDDALARAGSSRHELFSILRENKYLLFHVSSAFEDFPFGVEVDADFQSWSFNLAAIPEDQLSVDRWRSSMISPSR